MNQARRRILTRLRNFLDYVRDANIAEEVAELPVIEAGLQRIESDPGLSGVAFATSAKLPTPGAEVYPTQLVRAPDGGMYLLLSSGEMLDADGLGLAEDEHELRMRVWGAIKARRQSEGGK